MAKIWNADICVIGAGAAGLVVAAGASQMGADVVLIEKGLMGGDCLNYGCVPSKAIIKTAKVANQMRHADNYGLEPVTPAMSFKRVMARVHEVIAAIAPNDSVERYTSLGVDVVKGYAKIIDPWTVEIKKNDGGTQTLTTKNIVVATGAAPFIPELPGIEQSGYVTSDTLWTKFAELEDAPKRLIVLGGGPIGCELAQAFSRLGSDVTQVERAPRLMGREDADVAEYAESVLRESGVNVLTSHDALRFEQQDGEKVLVVAKEGVESTIAYDEVIVAVGRKARLHGFGLEDLGIQFDRTIETDEYLQTLMPNIFAAGDVVGPYQFTHVAAHQAWYCTINALFSPFKKFKVDYSVTPWCTFTDPEIARVGLNEKEANNRSYNNSNK